MILKEQKPGPANYFLQDSHDKIIARLKSQTLQKNKAAFNSMLERDCNKSLDKVCSLGPGAYIDINDPNNSAMNKTLLKFKTDRLLQELNGI